MRSDARAPERGFTLLEIVCTLVILGVLGSLVFSGFGTAITGYTQMREVGTSDMQAELALIRLRKELAGAADVPESPFKDSPSVTFTKTDGTQTTISCEDTGTSCSSTAKYSSRTWPHAVSQRTGPAPPTSASC